MNGNAPYAGDRDVLAAGRRAPEAVPSLSSDQRRTLRTALTMIEARTRELLPDEYVVGSEISSGIDGPRVTVAVQPPIGNPVSAGFAPDVADADPIDAEDREEVARGLAASAALQVKQAIGDDLSQTAK